MEVKPGHKRTELGAIPEGWEVKSLGALGAWRGGMTPSMQNPNFWQGGDFPWISSGDVKVPRLMDTSQHVTQWAVRQGAAVVVPANSLILVTRSGILRKYLPVALIAKSMAINQDIKALVPRDSASGEYLLHALTGHGDQILASCLKAGTTVESVEFPWLKAYTIPLPPLPEQSAIAKALSDVDALLAGLDRLISKKRDLKQAAMQQLLTGKTRLPGFQGEWKLRRLGELCSMKSGEGITSPFIDHVSPFPCYGGNGLRGFTTRFTHDGDYCLIGRVGALCGNVNRVRGKFFASEHAIVVTASEAVDVGWLTLVLGTLGLNGRAESSAQPVLTVKKLLPLEVFTPPSNSEQSAIAAVVAEMDAELKALEARRNKTRALKQGMMQELLTGRTRLV